MPQINLEHERREAIARHRETMRKTLRRGSFMTLDAPFVSMMVADGRRINFTPAPDAARLEAEAEAREERESRAFVDKYCYR